MLKNILEYAAEPCLTFYLKHFQANNIFFVVSSVCFMCRYDFLLIVCVYLYQWWKEQDKACACVGVCVSLCMHTRAGPVIAAVICSLLPATVITVVNMVLRVL